jgi:ABC-type sugar transport system ATPase subunit
LTSASATTSWCGHDRLTRRLDFGPRKAKEAANLLTGCRLRRFNSSASQRLSGGNQQRVVLAKWMAAHPRLLILNRPTTGIDIGSKQGIHQIITELAEKKVGVIVVSDDLPELMLICDRIIVMRAGAIVAERNVSESSEQEITQIVTESAP